MTINNHLKAILKEMVSRIGINYNDIDFKSNDWYLQHSWTTEEQDDFGYWMIDYLKNNKKAREELMTRPCKNKNVLERSVSEFIFNYGWKVENNETETK